jgi:hypothetical protein
MADWNHGYIRSRQAPSINAAVPVHTPLPRSQLPHICIKLLECLSGSKHEENTHINHWSVENLTASTRSLNPATSCSILASVSLMRISWPFASSLIRPFSRFKSSLTDACVRDISSRNLLDSFARSEPKRSCDDRVNCDSVESEFMSSERNLAKSTFWVYVLRSASVLT